MTKLSIISFTSNGGMLANRLAKILYTETNDKRNAPFHEITVSVTEANNQKQSVGEWTMTQMSEKNALLFIGACGIAVRLIAPYLSDKLHDSPVLVMDERGRYVIPILSGHYGGANALACFLAEKIGGVPVITTATDLNDKFAVDLFAKKNHLWIANKDGIAKVSAKVLQGRQILVSIEKEHFEKESRVPGKIKLVSYPPKQPVDVVITSEDNTFDTALLLKPKEYVIGIGCRRGKEANEIESFLWRKLDEFQISPTQVFALSSVSQKQKEAGILAWCQKRNVLFLTYTVKELKDVNGTFHGSSFVQNTIGVDNVCERAAVKACGNGGQLIMPKYAENGMTVAIAKRKWKVTFDEE